VRRLAVVAIALWAGAQPARADTITLKNGHVIEADRVWYDGNQLMYEKNGATFGLPRSLVQGIEQKATPEPSGDSDVLKGRERLQVKDYIGAVRFLKIALSRDPRSIAALHSITEAYLGIGDYHSAKDAAEKALRVDGRNPRSLELLGDALSALGERAAAEQEYRRSLLLRPDPEVQKKIGDVAPPPVVATKGPEFRIKYDGGVNEPLGVVVLEVLTGAYNEYAGKLGFSPGDPVTVILQTGTKLQESGMPEWAGGVNDGSIRVPVQGLSVPNLRVIQVLRHELAHSFVASRTAGNCPTWLQEGIAMWLEGGDPGREDARLAPLARDHKLHSLLTLEAPFQTLSEADAPLAYSESLSAVAHILRRRGEAGVGRLIAALGDRLPSEEALPVALAWSYPEFERDWEDYLRTADRKPAP
jgi:tetratricopeptide (TPR) repeat protein